MLIEGLAARRTPGGILVEWRAAEAAGAAFVVWRAESAAGPYRAVSRVIPALGGRGLTPYAWLDADGPRRRGGATWYRVERLPYGAFAGPVQPAAGAYVGFLPWLGAGW